MLSPVVTVPTACLFLDHSLNNSTLPDAHLREKSRGGEVLLSHASFSDSQSLWEFHLRMTLALIFPLSAKCFKQQPFHGALGTMHHSLGAIAVWPWERPSPHSHDLLFEANVCLWLSETLNFRCYLLRLAIHRLIFWIGMCVKVLLVTVQPTLIPRGSSDHGIEEESESLGRCARRESWITSCETEQVN